MSYLKVLIVDDEKPSRELLSMLINWEELGFQIVYKAKNGKEAFEQYQKIKPDLIITDISMPVMNGLELISAIRENDHNQKIVILSCYEEFSYAKEAIRMGVSDYIIKDMITKEDLYSLLLNIKEQIGLKDATLEDDNIANNEELNRELKKIILDSNYKPLEYKINIKKNKLYLLLLISIDGYNAYLESNTTIKKEFAKSKLTEALKNVNLSNKGSDIVTYSYIGDGKFVVLVEIEKGNSELETIKESHILANQIRNICNKYNDKRSITIVIGRSFREVSDIKDKYLEGEEILKYRLFYGENKNLLYNLSIPKVTKVSERTVENLLRKIEEFIDSNDYENLKNTIKEMYINNLKGFMQYNYLYEINLKLLLIISKYCNSFNIDYKIVFNENNIPLGKVNSLNTIEEMQEVFLNYFKILIDRNKERVKFSRHISDAIEYIKDNYHQKIMLEELADILHIHKVYLSRLFKDETGMTVTEYIVKQRMEKAKELIINTNMKFYEIGEKVSYNNSQQFFTAFKKYTNDTPKRFRSKYR